LGPFRSIPSYPPLIFCFLTSSMTCAPAKPFSHGEVPLNFSFFFVFSGAGTPHNTLSGVSIPFILATPLPVPPFVSGTFFLFPGQPLCDSLYFYFFAAWKTSCQQWRCSTFTLTFLSSPHLFFPLLPIRARASSFPPIPRHWTFWFHPSDHHFVFGMVSFGNFKPLPFDDFAPTLFQTAPSAEHSNISNFSGIYVNHFLFAFFLTVG